MNVVNFFGAIGDVTGDTKPIPDWKLFTPVSNYFGSQGKAIAEGYSALTGGRGAGKGLSGERVSAEALSNVPGRVQSRINLAADGMEHVVQRYLSGKANASQFTIAETELRGLLQSRTVVNTPVTRLVESADGLRYVREVNVGRSIGLDKFSGNRATSVMTVMSDKFGSLVTAFPGLLK